MKASGQETDLQDKVHKLEKTEKRCAHLDQKLETTIKQTEAPRISHPNVIVIEYQRVLQVKEVK